MTAMPVVDVMTLLTIDELTTGRTTGVGRRTKNDVGELSLLCCCGADKPVFAKFLFLNFQTKTV